MSTGVEPFLSVWMVGGLANVLYVDADGNEHLAGPMSFAQALVLGIDATASGIRLQITNFLEGADA